MLQIYQREGERHGKKKINIVNTVLFVFTVIIGMHKREANGKKKMYI